MKHIIASLLVFFVLGLMIPNAFAENVPEWVKNTAGWWATDAISETEFVNAIEFLVKENIIQVDVSQASETSQGVPDWVKNTVGWWADDKISETEFVKVIAYLIKVGIIIIETSENEKQFVQNPMKLLDDLSFLEQILIPDKQSEHLINSHGLRGPEISESKPSDTYRIFVVGGSTIYGYGVNDANTIPSLLQKKIEENNPSQTVEVINAGIVGGTSYGEVKLIKEKLLSFAPDIIIVYDGFNDIQRYYGENNNPETSKFSDKRGSPTEWGTRWIELCKFGEEHNFNTIVTLQPFLGIGNKLYTDQERAMIKSYIFPEILTEGYLDYVAQLEEINQNCTAAYDLRYIFDDYLEPIYWDFVHVENRGNEIVAKLFYEIINDHIKNNINDENSINKFSSFTWNFKELLANKIINEIKELSNKDYSGQNLSGKNFFADEIRNSNFSNANLSGANFRYALLENVDFINADLTGANFAYAVIKNSDFTGANLTDIYASNSMIYDSFFYNTNLSGAFFEGANIQCGLGLSKCVGATNFENTNFENTNLSKTQLFNLDISNSKIHNTKFIKSEIIKVNFPEQISADFTGAGMPQSRLRGDLSNVIFSCYEHWCTDFSYKTFSNYIASGTDLSNSDLSKRDLSKFVFSTVDFKIHKQYAVKFNFSNLSESIFTGSNLTNVDFTGADLTFSDLSDTNMSYTNLSGADLTGVNLSGANLEGANIQGALLDNAILSNANLKCLNHPICLNE